MIFVRNKIIPTLLTVPRMTTVSFFSPQNKPDVRIAYHAHAGSAPGVMFCGGLMSDMSGTKATALEAHCVDQGIGFIRFDYQGHGESSGRFEEGSVGEWASDALAVLDELADGPQIVVGSSLGGWIMLLLALARPEKVAGLVGIAAAPDFPEKLMWEQLSDAQRTELEEKGMIYIPSDYGDEPYPIRYEFIRESRQHHLLDSEIAIDCPIHLLHGMADPDVPWEFSPRIAERVTSQDVEVTLVKQADHRFSEPENIKMILQTADSMRARVTA